MSGIRAYLRLARGDFDGARADWERSLALAREATDPQTVLPAIFQAARGLAIVGEEREARALALEGLEIARGQVDLADLASNLVGVARQLGLRDDVRDVIAQAPPSTWSEAGLAAAEGDFLRAAEIYEHTGALAIAAEARFRAGEELIEQGDRASGQEQLRRALAFYRPFEARYFVDRARVLLAERESA